MANEEVVVVFGIPSSYSPIVRASKEYLAFCAPEWVAPNSVNRSCMAIVVIKILIWVRNLALMNRAILSCCKISNTILSLREINTQTTSCDKVDTTLLLFFVSCGRAKYILLIWICLPSQLGKCQKL